MSSLEKEVVELKTQVNLHKAIEKIQTQKLDAVEAYKKKLEEISKKTKNGQLRQILDGVTNTLADCLKVEVVKNAN